MVNTSTTSQTILLWVYSKPKPWNKQVQGPGVHHLVVGVTGRLLGRYQGYVTTYYNAALSDLLSQMNQHSPPSMPGTPFPQLGQPSDPCHEHQTPPVNQQLFLGTDDMDVNNEDIFGGHQNHPPPFPPPSPPPPPPPSLSPPPPQQQQKQQHNNLQPHLDEIRLGMSVGADIPMYGGYQMQDNQPTNTV